jgi:hypothetical protein
MAFCQAHGVYPQSKGAGCRQGANILRVPWGWGAGGKSERRQAAIALRTSRLAPGDVTIVMYMNHAALTGVMLYRLKI